MISKHMSIHTGERPYQSSKCNMTFSFKINNVVIHKMIPKGIDHINAVSGARLSYIKLL